MKVFFFSIFLMATPLAMAVLDEFEEGYKEGLKEGLVEGIKQAEKSSEASNQPQDGLSSCFDRLNQSNLDRQERMDRELENLEKQVKNLQDVAVARFENLSQCRGELRGKWAEYQKEQFKRDKERSSLSIQLRLAELGYQKALNGIRRQCRQQSNAEFAEYKKRAHRQAAVVGPHQLHGLNDRINSYRRNFYENCYRSPENVQAMQIASKELTLKIDKANTEMGIVEDQLQSVHRQIAMTQKDTLRDCEGKKNLIDYNQALAQQITAKASFNNSSNHTRQMQQNRLVCVGAAINTLINLGSSQSTTTPRVPAATQRNSGGTGIAY